MGGGGGGAEFNKTWAGGGGGRSSTKRGGGGAGGGGGGVQQNVCRHVIVMFFALGDNSCSASERERGRPLSLTTFSCAFLVIVCVFGLTVVMEIIVCVVVPQLRLLTRL